MLTTEGDSDGVVWCRLSGDLDLASANSVRAAVPRLEAGAAVIVDLAGVGFIDSSGLAAVVGLVRRVRDAGGEVVISSPTRSVDKMFRRVQLDHLVQIAPSDNAARIAASALRDKSGGPGPQAKQDWVRPGSYRLGHSYSLPTGTKRAVSPSALPEGSSFSPPQGARNAR